LRILGVDPGSWSAGWALVGGRPSRPELLDAGVVRPGTRATALAVRLSELHDRFGELLARLAVDAVAVEAPFHGVNARSALQLAHARGVILAVLGAAGLDVAEYAPAVVKKAVTGNGRAPKEQIRSMVECLLRTAIPGGAHDLADAAAVALCHQQVGAHRAAVARAAGFAGAERPRRALPPDGRRAGG
jgi:crossover junction endodeoxyribonuclease RuvC